MKNFLLDLLEAFLTAIITVFAFIMLIVSVISVLALSLLLVLFLIGSLIAGFSDGWSELGFPILISFGVALISAIIYVVLREVDVYIPRKAPPSVPTVNYLPNRQVAQQLPSNPYLKYWDVSVVQKVIDSAAAYGKSLGESVNTNLKVEQCSSYFPPISTEKYTPTEAENKLKEYLYDGHKRIVDQYGYCPQNLRFNIIAKARYDKIDFQYWEIYLLY